MAQPTPYTREFNFSNQQAATPATPIPAPHLDAELNRIKLTTDEIIENLGLIQSDEGGIAAGVVDYDALSATLKAQLQDWTFSPFITFQPNGDEDDTAALQALVDAASSGETIIILAGTYLGTDTVTIEEKTLRILAHGVTFVQAFEGPMFVHYAGWGTSWTITGITQEAVLTDGGTTHVVSVLDFNGVTPDLNPADPIKVFSTDTMPKVRFSIYKLGEFAIVGQTDGDEIALSSRLGFKDLYTTGVKAARPNDYHLHWEGGIFDVDRDLVNPTGELLNGGAMSHILCIGGRHHVIRDVHIDDSIANAITMHGCFGYYIENITGHDLPDNDPAYKLGYLVCNQQSEFGTVVGGKGVVTRNTAQDNLFNPEGAIEDFPMFPVGPHNYGRSAHGMFFGLNGVGGGNGSAFSNHAGCYYMRYVDCHHVAAGASETAGSDASGRGFANRGDYTQFINCSSVSDRTAIFIFSESDRIGGDIEANYCVGTRLVNFVARDTGLYNVFLNRALDVEIIGGNIAVARDTVNGARCIYAEKSTYTLADMTLDYAVSDSEQPVIEHKNSKIRFRNITLKLNERILNGSDELVNWLPRFIKVDPTSTVSEIFGRNLDIVCDVPFGFLVDNTGDIGTSFIEDVRCYVTNRTSLLCDDAVSRNTGVQGGFPYSYAYRDSQQANGNLETSLIRGFVQFEDGIPSDVRRSDVLQHTSVSVLDDFMKYNAEKTMTITLTPTVNQDVDANPEGHMLGQVRHIINDNSGGFTITWHNDSGSHGARIYTKSGADEVTPQHGIHSDVWKSGAYFGL
jgi:hypothetical protein